MMRPLGDRIFVKRVKSSTQTSGGIFIPDSAQASSMEGVILAVGPGSYDKKGNRNKMNVSEGQRVIFGKWSGDEIVIDGEDYRVPVSVLKSLKAILEARPEVKNIKVSKTGEGLKTEYTVIPL